MSNFNQYVTSRLDFDNGYSVSFDKVPGMGEIFCSIYLKGERLDVARFLTTPTKNDGLFAYLNPEAFAEVVYRVSKEAKE